MAAFDDFSERGLLGVAFDPGFPASPFVYVYYTVCKVPGSGSCQTAKNRVTRFTAGYQGNPDRADPTSQVVLLDDIDSDAGNHNGGWLDFGPLDGKLYVSTGDGGSVHTKSQDVSSLNGKILRLNPDGTVPFDNPFVGLFGARGEVYALGFRNPWRCRFHPDGRLFCGDVGENTWEEIDWVVAGGNYGWPTTEGDFNPATYPQFVRPIFTYSHASVGGGASITGGDFGSETSFPGDYQQSYFFGDYVVGFIRRVILGADGVSVIGSATGFATVQGVTDLIAGPDGALYYTDIFAGGIHRIATTGSNSPPVARATATPSQGAPPLTVQFSSAGSTDANGDPLSVLWNFGDGTPTSTAVAPSHTYTALGEYTATLTVSDGRTPAPGTDTMTLPITVGSPPVVTITQPAASSSFQGGQTITIAGTAADAEDGVLPPSALVWEVRFQHDTHWHPYLSDVVGSPQSFVTATSGETSANVWYRIFLRATDSAGIMGETFVDILPRTVTVRLDTTPSGLQLTLDGQPVTAPTQFAGVVGVVRTIGAPSPQGQYTFNRWSDGGVQVHTISTPAANTTYTAIFNGPTTTTTAPPTTTSSTTSTTRPPTTTTSPTTSTMPTTTSTTAPTTTTTLARFGNATVAPWTSVNSADYERMSPFALGESGTVTRLLIYLASPGGGTQRMRPVIYRDAGGRPGALAATGPERVVTAAPSGEWVGLPLASPVTLVPGTYWLGLLTGDTSQATVHFLGSTPGEKVYAPDTYANGPADPAPAGTVDAGPMSVYAEYTPTAATVPMTTTTTPPTTTTNPPTTTTTSPTTSTMPTTTSTTAPTTTTTLARFGNATVAPWTSVNSADYERMSPFALGESGTVTRLLIYLASPGGGTQRMRPVIYRDAGGRPGALAATGPERVVTAAPSGEWVGLPLASPVTLVPGTYWLGLLTGDTSQATVHFLGSTPGEKVYAPDTYANGPADPAPAGTVDAGPMSVYAEYSPTAATTTTTPPATTTSSTTSTTQPPTTTTSTTATTAPPTTTTLPRFGNTTVGSATSINTADYERMSPFVLGESGTVTRLVIYLASPGGGAQRMRPVIYRDAGGRPGALAATGPERMVTAAAGGEWIGLPLTAPVTLAPGTYWLGVLTGDTSQATVHFLGATPGQKAWAWDAYGNGPADPAPAPMIDGGPMSVFAEYTR